MADYAALLNAEKKKTSPSPTKDVQQVQMPVNPQMEKRASQEVGKQENKETSFPGNKQTSILVNKVTVKQVSQETRKRATYPKVTYQLNPTVTNLLQDTKIALQRQYNVKVSLAEIVEEAVQHACADLQENKETSYLVSLFTRRQGNK